MVGWGLGNRKSKKAKVEVWNPFVVRFSCLHPNLVSNWASKPKFTLLIGHPQVNPFINGRRAGSIRWGSERPKMGQSVREWVFLVPLCGFWMIPNPEKNLTPHRAFYWRSERRRRTRAVFRLFCRPSVKRERWTRTHRKVFNGWRILKQVRCSNWWGWSAGFPDWGDGLWRPNEQSWIHLRHHCLITEQNDYRSVLEYIWFLEYIDISSSPTSLFGLNSRCTGDWYRVLP